MLTNKIKKINIKHLNIPVIFHITEFKCFRMLTHIVLQDNRKVAKQHELIMWEISMAQIALYKAV